MMRSGPQGARARRNPTTSSSPAARHTQGSKRRFGLLGSLAAPLSLLIALQPQGAAAAPMSVQARSVDGLFDGAGFLPAIGFLRAGNYNRVDGLSVTEGDDGSTILRFRGNAKPTFNVYRLDAPSRLVVDISASQRGKVVPHLPLDTWACGRVTIEDVSERGAKLVRIVIELKRESSYIVVPDRDQLVVTVTPREMPPEAYFAHKSASRRKAELEAERRAVAKASKTTKALQVEAKALNAEAARKAEQAEARASRAAAQAQRAKASLQRAQTAEQRAQEREAAAQKALREAKGSRVSARKALADAKAERERLAAERARAQAELSDATRKAEAQQELAAQAQRRAEQAEARARKLLARAKVTSAAAEEKMADATAKQSAARKELQRARAQAEETEKKAQAGLQRAEAEARRTELLAKEKLARAAEEARNAQRAAQTALHEARANAKQAKQAAQHADAEAKERLAQAEAQARQQLAEAKKHLEQTKAAAQAELTQARKAWQSAEQRAQRRLASARAEAERARAEAAQTRAEAARILARAEKEAAEKLAAAEETGQRAKQRLAAAEETGQRAKQRLAAAEETGQRAQQRLAAAEATGQRAKQRLAAAEAKAKQLIETAEEQAEQRAKQRAQQQLTAAQAKAKQLIEAARKEAESIRQRRLAQAKTQAARTIAAAQEQARKEAQRAVAAAQAKAKESLAQAKAKGEHAEVARAKKELARLEAERGELVAKAEKQARQEAEKKATALLIAERARIEADARKRVQIAEGTADKAQAEARAKLAQATAALSKAAKERAEAERTLAAATRKLEEASQQRVEAQEQRVLAERQKAQAEQQREQAERDKAQAEEQRAQAKREQALAEREKAQAEKTRKQAEAALAAAATEANKLAQEKQEALRARREAEAALARVQADAARAREAGRNDGSHAKQIAAAQRAKKEAGARQAKAEAALADVERKRTELERTRSELERKRTELDAELARKERLLSAREAKLARREDELDQARRSVERTKAKAKAEAEAEAEAESKRAAQRKATPPQPDGPVGRVKDVRFESDEAEERVIVQFEGALAFSGSRLTPTIQMLQFEGAKMAESLERSLDASAYKGPVKLITSFREGNDAKVIVSTQGTVKPKLEERAGELVWHFPRKGPAASKPDVVSMAGTKVAGVATAANAPAMMAPARGAQPDVTQGRRSTRWRGERIDIELQDAPIDDVLLLFSDIGRVNIVAGEGVEGTVTMKLQSVPWDQALDIILRSLNLGSVREGNVVRVATLEDLEAERRAAIERANAQVQLKPLETRLVPISYATVDEMIPKVQNVMSPRGRVTPDSRTNTLIIMDVTENIALAEELVRSLDTQTPQVLIEARIVEARTNFTRQLGVQWGFDYTASPGTGNPTGLLFPNSVGVGGGATGQPADTRGLILPAAAANPNYAVDLPAPVGTGSGGAIGFSFGSLSGNLNTNLRLSAAETTGEVRIISAPKIVTLDNSEAEIEQGVQIPISQISAQGVNTRFVNATLSLQVTPHVTNEGAVLLDVTVQKNEADFVNTGARGDPTILTKQAQSRMLVNDSDTAVIGGIYTRNKAVNYSKVPWLGDIPIIGWFFKQKSEADTRSEVLIFLTPKIVNRASSIGG